MISISPLLSQPVIETALKIPLHVLRSRGRDRSVARRAFSSDLPKDIVLRKSKAQGSAAVGKLVQENASLIRSYIHDGYLVRERMLDVEKVRCALNAAESAPSQASLELFNYFNVEAWIRAVESSAP